MLTDVWTVEFELRFEPLREVRPDENPHHPDGCSNLPIYNFGKNRKLDQILKGVRTGC
jgi:hypothetical protein